MNSRLITKLREKKVWTQVELAKQAGVSKGTIGKAESGGPGEYPKMEGPIVRNIAAALGVEPNEIVMSEGSLLADQGPNEELIRKLQEVLRNELEIGGIKEGSIIIDLVLTSDGVERLNEAIAAGEFAEFGHVEFKLLEADEENGLNAIADADQQKSDVSNGRAGRPVPVISWKTMSARLAIAASLLLCGVMLDRTVFRATDPDGFDVLVGSASTSFLPGRGPNEQSPHIEIRSPISGFVTVISLAPDRRPLVYPRTGGADFRVRDGVSTEPHKLPDDTTTVVYVVTKTPASHTIRRLEEDIRDLRPGDESQIQTSLEALLNEYGFGKVSIGKATFEKE